MIATTGGIIILSLILILAIVYCAVSKIQFVERERKCKKNIILLESANEELHENVEQKRETISKLFQMLEETGKKRLYYRERTIELEDAIEQGYGVKIRKEITVVNTEFTKLEMVVMFAGVNKLLTSPKTADDAEIYLNLIKKIQPIMDLMEEPPEKKE